MIMGNWERNHERWSKALPGWRSERRRQALTQMFYTSAVCAFTALALDLVFHSAWLAAIYLTCGAAILICTTILRITINGIERAPDHVLDEYEADLVTRYQARAHLQFEVALMLTAVLLVILGVIAPTIGSERIVDMLIPIGLGLTLVNAVINGIISIRLANKLGEPWTNTLPAAIRSAEDPAEEAKVWAADILAKKEIDPTHNALLAIRTIRLEAPKLGLRHAIDLVRAAEQETAKSHSGENQ